MAGDTRDDSSPTTRGPAPGEIESSGTAQTPSKNYEVFHSPPASANSLPAGSGQNTAGSKLTPTFADALKTVRLQDFSQVHMYPCVRESLLMGIGAGFGIGGVRGILGGELPSPSA
jgi:cytochrome c oxidase assembly protein subunit 20